MDYFKPSATNVATLAAAAMAATIRPAIFIQFSCHHSHDRAACSFSSAQTEARTLARTCSTPSCLNSLRQSARMGTRLNYPGPL
jgi:hypothetical protein